jgi:uncharacterized protein YndB with AHSA1/START domain
MTDLPLTLSVRRTIKATPEQVYNAWLDPAIMSQFMAGGSDQIVAEARSDARVGGGFYVLMRAEKDVPHQGIYKALTPHSRIVFTWDSPYSPADSEVELLFTPVEGGTEVVLNQVKFLSEGARDGHIGGWTNILERLATVYPQMAA